MRAILYLKGYIFAFRELTYLLTRHRQLAWEMTKRDISDRYTGQFFGTLWAVTHPLFLMVLYVFIFAVVLELRFGGTKELPLDYTTYLLSGLIPWMCCAEVMSKSSVVIRGHSNLVKQVVFPIEVLPVKGVLASCLSQIVAMIFLFLYVFVLRGKLPWTYSLIPVLFVFQILFLIGVSFIFSAVGVYFGDLKDFVQLFCVAGLYLVPIFFLPQWVPDYLRPILFLNPFSYMVWCYQDLFYFGRFEHPWAWVIFLVMSSAFFLIGYRVFRRLRIMFGNVL
jgi:lipopolysaccharide transport system permease protein